MKTTGQILKENREKKGITLNEVALATKINVKALTAIEEGDLENLPTKTFLRGFVRSYARYLGLDEEAILSSFYEEMGSTKPKVNTIPEAKVLSDSESPFSPGSLAGELRGHSSKIIAVIAIIVLIALILVFKSKMQSYENETIVTDVPKEIEAVQRDESDDAPAATPAPTTAATPSATPGQTNATATPTAAATPAPTAAVNATPNVTPTATPKPTPKPTATPTPTPTPATTPTATPTPKPTATPLPTPAAAAAGADSAAATTATPPATPTPAAGRPQEVIVEAMDDVEVEATIDSEPPRKLRLKADQVQTFKARRKVVLRLSDGGAVNLSVNGADRGVPGDLGKPARVEFP